MDRIRRAGSSLFIGIIFALCLFITFGAALPVRAFFALQLDGEVVAEPGALIPLDSGVGIALSLLPELGFAVDRSAYPAIELRFASRGALLVVGDAEAVVDGKTVQLTAPPLERDGELYVPLTLIADLARLRIELNVAAAMVTLSRRDGGAVRVADAADPGRPSTWATAPESDLSAGLTVELDPVAGEDVAAEPDEAPEPDVATESGSAAESREEADAGSSRQSPSSDTVLGQIPPVDFDGGHRIGAVDEVGHDARAKTPEHPPAVVRDIRLVEKDGYVHIELAADGPLHPRIMYLDNPARLVIDMFNAVGAAGWRVAPGDGRIVEQLRVNGAEDGGLRVVADLTGPTGYTLEAERGDGVYRVRLNHQLQVLAAEAEGEDVALHLRATGPVPYRMFRLAEPERLVIDLFGVSIPEAEEIVSPGTWSSTLRLSQFDQSVVRAVFSLGTGVEKSVEPDEGILHPDADGFLRVLVNPAGLAAGDSAPPNRGDNKLQFVGFGRQDDLEFILIEAEDVLDVTVSRLRGPDRIVLDLPGVVVPRSLGLVPGESDVLRAVRAGQAEDLTARIVAETEGVAEHYLLLSPDKTRAVLGVRPSKLAGRTVVVDAGHGGRDPGAIGFAGTYEKDVTLSIALQVADLLGRAGANVVLTRDRDVELALAERAQLANLIRADAFVSIHADAVGFGRIASGTSTFYHPENGSSGESSLNRRYATTLQSELLQALGLPDRGVHERAFHVVLNTKMPSALVEVGFIDNPDEEQLLLDPDFQARAARGVANGIVRFFADEVAAAPEDAKQWQRRTAEATGLFVLLGTVPPGVAALEPTSAFTLARTEGRGAPEPELDMTATPRFPEL